MPKNLFKAGEPRPENAGRKLGTPNKTTALLKDAILQAAELAGHKIDNPDALPGLVNFLCDSALTERVAFLSLLGKVLPMQLVDKNGDDVQFTHIERVIIDARGAGGANARDHRILDATASDVRDAEDIRTSAEAS